MIYNEKDEEIREDREIIQICRRFYEKMYTQADTDNDDSEFNFVPSNHYDRKLTQEHINILDQRISKADLYEALLESKVDSAPGLDGLTVGFYREYWDLVGDLIYKSIAYAFEQGRFSVSQRRGIIKLIPKKFKNPHFVKNLRPITLLNVDYKLLTKALSMRFKLIMEDLILNDQNAFIRNRFIGSNVMDVFSLIEAAEENQEEAVLILLDIEKAFDSINWRFLKSILKATGVPDTFIRWIDVMVKDKELRIANNGFISDPFYPQKGVAQGCTLSPLIFIYALETLANIIRDDHLIKGITLGSIEKKIALAADDTLLSLQATNQCLSQLLRILKAFEKVSGLKVNTNKSYIIRVGKNKQAAPLNVALDLQWLHHDDMFTYLGLNLKTSNILAEDNFDTSVHSSFIQNAVQSLRYGSPSLIGRICILKQLVASKFVYRFTLLPSPPINFLKILNRLYDNYVWKSGRHRIARHVMERDIVEGGFKMISAINQEESLKLIWIDRCIHITGQRSFWQTHINSCFIVSISELLRFNITYKTWSHMILHGKRLPQIWKDIFRIYFQKYYTPLKSFYNAEYAINLPICFNSAIRLGPSKRGTGLMLQRYNYWKGLGVTTIKEFLNVPLCIRNSMKWHAIFEKLPLDWVNKESEKKHFMNDLLRGTWKQRDCVRAFVLHSNNQKIKAIDNWKRDLNVDITNIWKNLCARGLLITDVKTRSFHIEFLNKAFHLNKERALYTTESPNCTFCRKMIETYSHMFFDCEKVQPLWEAVFQILEMMAPVDENPLNKINCLLSNFYHSLLILITCLTK